MEELTLLNQIAFWTFAGLMLASALGVVFNKSIVYSALMLLVTFLSIAGFFILLNAPFIAAAQILVYGVGLTIVLIFGIMLTGDKPITDAPGQEQPARRRAIPAVVCTALTGFVLWSLLNPNAQMTQIQGLFPLRTESLSPEAATALFADGGISHIGQLLFSSYLIPFELASVLLLLAMMGAIILSKRQLPEEELTASEQAALEAEFGCAISELSGGATSEKETMGVS